jgi:serine/threonine protein kinase
MNIASKTCPVCGTVLPKSTAAGMCPKCCLEMCLEATVQSLPTTVATPEPKPSTEAAPELIEISTVVGGRYKLLEQIGEGGFGIVYLAQQSEPVRRRVALKIVKPGMDTREVVARFEAERQALALMDHPNIAHVYDGGATESGRPYFVMELVKGVPLTKYCDSVKMGTLQRVELFLDVLSAVQHAHQKGIIHRDLKPSNILVSPHDSRPVVKVIDFGIAKALSLELTDKTLFTATGRMVGTPEYMSPEQTELNALDVDTRSDIYSLGVVLYELLTGNTPIDTKRARQAGYDEIQRIIREEEPPRPSTRISTLGDKLVTVAQHRGTEPVKLGKQVRGDLDWIVMKALEKERVRRYDTADMFAADLRRHLANEPVSTGPPSQIYRLRKFVRRRKGVIAASALILLVLLAGIAASLWQAVAATRARDEARTEAAISTAVNEFLRYDLLGSASPSREPDRDLKVRAVLDRASGGIQKRFQHQPLVEAAIRFTMASSYESLGESQKALEHARRSVELRQRELGPHHAETLRSRTFAGMAMRSLNQFADAEKEFREVMALQSRHLGPEHPDVMVTRHSLAIVLGGLGRFTEAEKELREIIPVKERVLGATHQDTLSSRNSLAMTLRDLGKLAEAEAEQRATLDLAIRHLGSSNLLTLRCQNNLGIILRQRGKMPEADEDHKVAVEQRQKLLGSEHPDTLSSRVNRGHGLIEQSKLAEAEAEFRELCKDCERVLGAGHPATLRAHNGLGMTLSEQAKYSEAEPEFRKSLKDGERTLGMDHPDMLNTRNNLALVLDRQGKTSEAESEHRKILEIRTRTLGAEHPSTLSTRYNLAILMREKGNLAGSEAEHRDLLAINTRVFGPEHPDTLRSRTAVANAQWAQGRFAEGARMHGELLKILERVRGPEHGDTLQGCLNLATCLNDDGKYEQALEYASRAVEGMRKVLGNSHPKTRDAARLYNELLEKM